mmetsp:Transcript_126548/g.236557  ORF Transcript_126548/g.236557 Transcript_126548/m.236557 type:complete len:238 (-) Transcript_126548:65-778(-)
MGCGASSQSKQPETAEASGSTEPKPPAPAPAETPASQKAKEVKEPRVKVDPIMFHSTLNRGELDTTEIMEQVHALFRKIDKDASGLVSRQEFSEEAPKINGQFFTNFDFHKFAGEDDMLSWLEFCAGVRSNGRASKEAMQSIYDSTATEKDNQILEGKLKQAKQEFDKVAGIDGKVDIAEFFQKGGTMPLFKDIKFAVAAGEDQTLSFEEFLHALRHSGILPNNTGPEKDPSKNTLG